MLTQSKGLDFSGQVFYVGLDVHKKNWQVCIRSNQLELKRMSMNPSPEELVAYMKHHYPGGSYHSAYEAGFCGFWIHRSLQENGFHNLVVHSPDIPTTDKEKHFKSDKVDAGKLCRELEKGSLKGIYVPSPLQQELRSLYRLRYSSIQSRTRVKNRIKSHLHYYGIALPSEQEIPSWSKRFTRWLESVEFQHASARAYLDFCLEEFKQHRERVVQITQLLQAHLKTAGVDHTVNLLQSIPGVGPVCSLAFYTELMDMKRFPTFDQLSSYFGLVPTVHSSGDRHRVNGLSNRRNRYLRHLIIEAAWIAVRKDPALLLAYQNLSKRMRSQEAIIRIAKKLLSRLRYVWTHQKEYIPAIIR